MKDVLNTLAAIAWTREASWRCRFNNYSAAAAAEAVAAAIVAGGGVAEAEAYFRRFPAASRDRAAQNLFRYTAAVPEAAAA